MDKQLKTFNYKYRKHIVGRKTLECDPLYLTQLIYTYYNMPITERFISMIIDGEFIELNCYVPISSPG